MANPNENLLREVNAAKTWAAARKTKSICARKMDADQEIETLEGKAQAKAGQWLCRAQTGEQWPQKEEKLFSTYDRGGNLPGDEWATFIPKPDGVGVLAAQIDRDFEVQASWGKLQGKAGDYLVKSGKDRDVEYPDDVWIVQRSLFDGTYETIPD